MDNTADFYTHLNKCHVHVINIPVILSKKHVVGKLNPNVVLDWHWFSLRLLCCVCVISIRILQVTAVLLPWRAEVKTWVMYPSMSGPLTFTPDSPLCSQREILVMHWACTAAKKKATAGEGFFCQARLKCSQKWQQYYHLKQLHVAVILKLTV